MPIAITPNSTFEYVLKVDRDLPEEERTLFRLRALSAAEQAKVEDQTASLSREDEIRVRSGSTILEALRLGLVGWEGFRDENGNEVPFRSTKRKVAGVEVPQCDPANLDWLLPEWRRELVEAITARGKLTEDDRGN